MLRLAKCCRPVPGDPIVGYVSLGRGITIHRDDCPNTAALRKDPERFVRVHWEGEHETSFKVELQVEGWDRHRLLEDLSRTFAEAGINIVEARCIVSSPMVKNRFVPVAWDGDHETAFRVELQVDAWDRHRLLEDLSRTFSEAGINIVEARCLVSEPMVKNTFVVEVADTTVLKGVITRLRNIDGVFDAYRVTPGAG